MYRGFKKNLKKYNKIFIVLLCILTITSFYWVDKAVLAASPYYFRGYDTENITSNTFSYSGAHLDGTNIVMTDETLGEAVGFLSLNEPGHDISTSVDLGGLEIDFATTSVVAQEGTAGSENDVPTVKIDFCGSNYSNVISTETIAKANNAVAGSVVLSSNVTIPSGTRSLIIYLDGQNTNQTSSNTVVFQNTSFIIHDQSAPSCGVNYNTSWTNGSVTITVTAADSDSGLEGIYKDGTKVSSTSPYSFTVSSNASYLIYSKDYAQKTSATQNVTINNIDKTVPSAPASITLSHDSWTNTDVGITMPTLTQDSGSPIRYIYKIDSGSWQDLPNNFILSNSGQYNISVAVADAAGNVSSSVSDIIYIDKLAPVINNVSQTVSSGSCVISVNTSDAGLSGLKETKYASGSHDAAYFTSGGTSFTDGAFTVSTGGIYTIYISDNAGNFITSEYTLNTAPSIVDLLDVNMNEDEIYNVPLNITENETSLDKLSVTATSSDTTLIPNIIINQSSDEISLDIVPGANLFGGPVTITVEVSDEQGEKVTDTFSVTVLAVNDAPIALDDAGIVTNEDESIRIDVLANDSDLIDGDSLTIIDAGTPLHGTASVVNGKIKYIPSADYNGTDSFTYTISDGNGGTASAKVYISATDVNDAPVAADDTAQTVEDSSVLIDVLINDNDIDMTTTDNEEISLISATNGSHGTTVIENGKIRYTPNADWFGKDVFTYTISDKAGLTDTAFVTVTVLGINDLPQFTGLNDEYTINEDSIAAPVTFSISDAETENRSLMLQAVSLNENIIENGKVKIEGLGDESASVSIKLTPAANAYGDVTIKLALGDGFTTVFKTIAVHVANVNDNPVAYADEIKYDEDTPYVLINTNNLISNDKDIDKDTLSFNGINTTTSVGTLEQVDSDTYKYIPQADYDGTDSFSYIVIDNNGGSAIGTCTLIANPINDAPSITIPQAEYITNEDTTISDINLNIYDKETNASGLIVRAGSNNTDLVSADKISVINNNDGTCTLTVEPMPDANGTAVINVTVSDGSLSSTKSVNLKINAVADAPVAVDDSIYVPISGKQSFNAMFNDRDADGDEINVVSFDASSLSGLLTYNDITKKFTYWASSGEHGESTFTYTISDGDETTSDSTATVTLDVHNINHAPQISAIANQHIAEDSRVDGISIKVSDEDYNDTISVNATSNNTTLIPQDYENNIIITDNHDGTYALSLVPAANMNGNVNITVTATDAAGSSDSTTFTLYVYPDNDAPLAVDDAVSTNEDNSVGLNLLSNDSDPEGDNIWINYIQTPSHGIISRSGNAYTYTPYGNYSGTEVLTYKTTDGQNASTATVTITVNPVNDAPIAWSDWRELPNEINQSSVISVLSNDYDPDGDTIHLYQIINQPSFGTAVVNANGTVTYTRTSISANANGADSFTYRIIDRETASGDYSYDDATVYIGVEFTSSLYTYDKYVSCMEDAAAFTITLPISNPNNVNLELTINDTTSLGTFEVIDATHVQFTPAANAYGNASITYTAEQVGGGESIGGEIILTVYPVNDEPIIDSAPASVSCDEDSAGSVFNVLFHDIDCTDGDLVFYAYAQNTSSSCPVVLTSDIQINRQTGTATVNAKPIENANGAVNIIVGVSDGISKTERTVAMTVNPVDDYPYVTSVNKTLYEDTNVTFGVILPNSDVDNDGLKVSIASGDAPAHGAAIVNADGTITYTPNEDYYGDDSLVFSVSDDTSAGLTSKQTAYFTITPVNDQPVISNLNYYQSTKEDTPKDVNLTVTDVDNDLSASSCYTITSSNQDLIPNSNISISQVSGYDMKVYLVPKANAYGSTIISITASDGELSTKAEFKLTVESVNDVPVANDDTASVDENVGASVGKTSVTINVTGNDTDVEDTTLKVSAISNISTGTVTNNNDGTLTYSADGDYNGTITFDYTVMDSSGASDTASVTVTINAMNDPPKTVDDYKTTQEDTQAVIAVLANDTDVEGDMLSLTDVYGCTHGTADIEGNNIVYTPNENYYGTDQFTYEVSDGNGGTSTAIVHMTITSVNDAPVIEKHSSNSGDWTMDEDTTAQFNFTVTDPETPTANLIITIDSQNTTILKNTGIVLSTNDEGYKTITVTPEENANGTVSIEINATDGDLTSTKVFEITINPSNDPPVVDLCSISTFEDVSFNGQLSSTDIDDESATYSKVTNPSHGTVEVNSNGSFTYTPEANYSGADSFEVMADDGHISNNTSTGTVYITVNPANDKPDATDDNVTVTEDTPQVIDVLSNDTDVDISAGDKITITSVSKPSHGNASVADGKVSYTPDENYNGTDSFTYTISDNEGEVDSAAVNITITSVNDAPANGNDISQTDEDTAVIIEAVNNDDIDLTTNSDTEKVNAISVDDPTHGTAVISDDKQKITYTPDENWFGTEVFYYTAQDSGELTASFSVTVTVNSVNDAPVIVQTLPNISTNEDTTSSEVTFTVTDVEDNDGELDVAVTHNNSTLLPIVTTSPDANGNCTFTVTPKANKNGTAQITVTVTDSDSATDAQMFTLTVNAVNDVPLAQNDAATTNENTAKTIDVLLNDDVDLSNEGDTLTLLALSNPSYGSAAIVNNKLVYTPNANLGNKTNYNDIITYLMKDDSGAESAANVIITVTPVNDAPIISSIADISGIDEDAIEGIGVIGFTVTDEEDDDDNLSVTVACNNTALFPLANITVTNPSGGTGTERTVQAIPAADMFGTATITLTVHDSQGRTSSEAFTVTVNSVNDTPENGNDSFTVVEDIRTQLDVLDNDDVDYQTTPDNLTITDVTAAPTHGTVEIAADGKSIYYTTEKDGNLPDSFTYKIYDSYGDAYYEFNVDITVTPVNDAPVVTLTGQETYTVYEGVAKNDIPFTVTDVDNNVDTLTVTAASSNPILVYKGLKFDTTTGTDRTIDVQPYLKWNGTTTITITAKDASGDTGSASFTFTVDSVNEAPVANNDAFTIPEDALTKVDVLANDTDGDLETNPDTEHIVVKSVVDNDPNAIITVAEDGSGVNIQPNANYNGPVSFTYIVNDTAGSESGSATVNVTVSQVNDAPVADDDSAVTNEDTPVTIDVLDGDTDIDQDITLNANPSAEVLSISIDEADLIKPAHGSITVTDNKIRYTPDANYNGTDSFEYNSDDGEALDKATVSVTIYQVNDNPVAVTDSATTDDEVPVSVNVLENDTDVDTVAANNQDVLHSADTFSLVSYDFIGDAHGTLSNIGGTITYTPSLNFKGTQEIAYVVSDGNGGSATGQLIVSVNEENDKPVANDDEISTDEDTPVTFNVLSNDTDQDIGDEMSFVMFTQDTSSLPGSFSANANGSITYTPDENYNGTFTLSYQMKDKAGLTDEAVITITVAAVNDAPVGIDNNAAINEDTSYTVAWTTLTSDVDIATNADSIGVSIKAADNASHGSATVAGNNIVYTPIANFNGTDSFTYTVTDSAGATDTGVISVTVSQVNDAPAADDDSAVTNEDTPVTIDVLDGDTDIDQDASLNANPSAEVLSISIDEADLIKPAHGSISIVDNKIVYTPDVNYNGTDSFEYNSDDGEALDKATVSVTIYQVNDNPVAVNDIAQTNDEEPVTIDVLANDNDVDTQTDINLAELHSKNDFMLTSVDKPDNGTAEIKNGKIYYKPDDTFSGDDTFKYTISDGQGGSASADITVTVLSVNDPPATPIVITPKDKEQYGTGSTIHVTWTGYDIDGDSLTYTLEYYDGKSWQVIQKGLTDTQYDFAIPATLKSISNLQFRVNASDAEYTSDYGYSGKLEVDKDAPKNIVVTMKTQDGKNYTAGTWTNQNVTITAISVQDASKVTFSYAIEDKAYSVASNLTVTDGVHTVYILATDEFGNQTVFGGYLVKIDKLSPAVPSIDITTSDNGATIKLTLKADPGGSGNNYLILPSNSQQSATGDILYSVDKNGIYHFVIYDKAGNSTEFDATVDQISQGGGDVDVDLDEIEKIVDDADKVRLPGGEWTDTLTLKDAKPGTYTIEVMDKNGNISTVTITITDEEVAKGYWQASDGKAVWYISVAVLALIIIILLLAYNIKITAIVNGGSGEEKVLKTKKKLKMRKDEVIVALKQKDFEESDYIKVELTKSFTKAMRGRALVVMLNKAEIIRTRIPDNAEGKYGFTINKTQNQ